MPVNKIPRDDMREGFKNALATLTHIAFSYGYMQHAGVEDESDAGRVTKQAEAILVAYMDMYDHVEKVSAEAFEMQSANARPPHSASVLQEIDDATLAAHSRLTAIATGLFDNRLGWSEGRNPYAPRAWFADLGAYLYGEDDPRVKELRDPRGGHVEGASKNQPCECSECEPDPRKVAHDHHPNDSCGPECFGIAARAALRDEIRTAATKLIQREPQGPSVGDIMLAMFPVFERWLPVDFGCDEYDDDTDIVETERAEVRVPDSPFQDPHARGKRQNSITQAHEERMTAHRANVRHALDTARADGLLDDEYVDAVMESAASIDVRAYNAGFADGYTEGHTEGVRVGRGHDLDQQDIQGWTDERITADVAAAIRRAGGVGGLASVDDLARAVLPIVRDSWVHGYIQKEHETFNAPGSS